MLDNLRSNRPKLLKFHVRATFVQLHPPRRYNADVDDVPVGGVCVNLAERDGFRSREIGTNQV